MDLILSLDQGTTSSRAILFDRQGQSVALAQQEFAQIFSQSGWVEHDASQIWHTQLAVAQRCIQMAAETLGQIPSLAAIAITNQRETTVLWDRLTGEPLAHAIVWQDRRTAGRCDALREAGVADMIQQKTGLMLDAYFSATKLEWLLDHVLDARARAERGELAFGTIDSWLIYKLTGGQLHVTDVSNASRTMLLNIHTVQWDDALLQLFRIPKRVLPQIVPSSGVVAMVEASLLGLPAGQRIAIAGIAGDQQAATFGQTCFAPGMAKCTYGTGCFMLMNTGNVPIRSQHRSLTTIGWQASPAVAVATNSQMHRTAYCLEGSVFMAGAVVQWLRDGLEIIETAAEVQSLANSVPDTGDVYFVPAFAGLGAPYWDGHARALLMGMTRGTTKAHIARAALEAIALQVTELMGAMIQDSGIALTELRVDGGASRNDLLMQMQADFLGVPVVRPQVTEATALGAAYLAGLAVGYWENADVISAQWIIEKRFMPRMGAPERAVKLTRWRQAVERSRSWAL